MAHWKLIIDVMLGPIGVLLTNLDTVKKVIDDIIHALEDIGGAVSKALGWLGKLPKGVGGIDLEDQPVQRGAGAGPGAYDDGVPDHGHARARTCPRWSTTRCGTISAATSAPSWRLSSGERLGVGRRPLGRQRVERRPAARAGLG